MHPKKDDDINKNAPQEVKKSPNPLLSAFDWYNQWLIQKPIITKCITAAIINLLGDVMAQCIEAQSSPFSFFFDMKQWDGARLQTFFLCGLFFNGPYVHWWYERLVQFDQWIKRRFNLTSKPVRTMAQLTMDQTVGAVLSLCLYFYVYETIDAVVHQRVPVASMAASKLSENFGSILMTNYCIWPVVNWISFTYVPIQFRVLLNNVIGIMWNAFLSMKMTGGI